jgi:hypothetical protein
MLNRQALADFARRVPEASELLVEFFSGPECGTCMCARAPSELFSVTLISSTPRFNTFICAADVDLSRDIVFALVVLSGLAGVLLRLVAGVSLRLAKRMTRSCTWNVAPVALLPFGTELADELGAEEGWAALRLVCGDEGGAPGVTPAAVAKAVEGGVAAAGAS